MLALDPTFAPERVQRNDADEQGTTQQQQQQDSSASSMTRSIASLFSTEADELDAIELKKCGGEGPPQPHHSGDDGGSLREQTTLNLYAHRDDDTPTGSTAPDHKRSSEVASSTHLLEHVPSRFSIFWRNHIAVVVHIKDARDHLALERTYLAYHRTGMVFAMLATATAQLTVINHTPSPSSSFGFHVLGKPLSVALAACALLSSVVGVIRWWRLQQGLLRGVAISGGREVLVISGIVGVIILTFFGLTVAVDLDKEHQ